MPILIGLISQQKEINITYFYLCKQPMCCKKYGTRQKPQKELEDGLLQPIPEDVEAELDKILDAEDIDQYERYPKKDKHLIPKGNTKFHHGQGCTTKVSACPFLTLMVRLPQFSVRQNAGSFRFRTKQKGQQWIKKRPRAQLSCA